MELRRSIPESLYPPPSFPTAGAPTEAANSETHATARNPLPTLSSVMEVESAFLRMSISAAPDVLNSVVRQSLPDHPAYILGTHDSLTSGVHVSSPMETQRPEFWLVDHDGRDAEVGFFPSSQTLNSSPGRIGLYENSAYYYDDSVDYNLLNYYQRLDVPDIAYCRGGNRSSPALSRTTTTFDFPYSLSAERGNIGVSRGGDGSRWTNFRTSSPGWPPNSNLDRLRSSIALLARDEEMSGFLRMKLEEGLSEQEIDVILSVVTMFLGELMKHELGIGFMERLFPFCNEEQMTRMILSLTEFPFKLIDVCLDSNGAKAMQKLLQKLTQPHQVLSVISAVTLAVVVLANDSKGQHVVEYCIKQFPEEYSKPLSNEIADKCLRLATNKSGCCLLQSCMEDFGGEARKRLIYNLIADAVHLAEDPYGNYVVQYLLKMRIPEAATHLLRQFQGCFVALSCNKYASNVVETFLCKSGGMYAPTIVMELVASPHASMLLLDPYGNFVIQSALKNSKDSVLDALLNLINLNMESMQSNPYGKKILAWVVKRNI